jgi:hypothetical protein
MMREPREVAEVQILVPEPVAKRWWEGVEKMAISADISKFGIIAPSKGKFAWVEPQCAFAPPCDFDLDFLSFLNSSAFQAKNAGGSNGDGPQFKYLAKARHHVYPGQSTARWNRPGGPAGVEIRSGWAP